MDNSTFGYLLNESLDENERIFKLSGAVLNETDELVITLLAEADNYDKLLDDKLKAKTRAIVKGILPKDVPFHIVYKKTETSERYILQNIHDFFYKESSLLFSKLGDVTFEVQIEYGFVKIKVGAPPDIFGYLADCGYDQKLATYLESQIIEDVEIEFYRTQKKNSTDGMRKIRTVSSVQPSLRVANVKIKVDLIGTIARKPVYIVDALKKESELVTLCGKVDNVRASVSKNGKPYFRFTIDDTTGKVDCLIFTRFPKQQQAIRSYVLQDIDIVAEGELKMDVKYGTYTFWVRRIAVCDIDYASINTDVIYNDVPEDYYTVFPEPYSETEQGNLFDEKEEVVPDLLKGRIVVFDLETTGLQATSCKIIEIGAVLMVDGVIKQTFSTLINPEEHIPEDASRTNNIYDEDVKDAPLFKDIVGDFYKFCYGATMCAHNAPFDIGFITYHGRQFLYNFDNPVIDTLAMAKKIFKRDRNNNLGDLCKQFDIDLTNAHRALFDTIATAKVLKKLASYS